jgi:hypothetical protein
MRRKVRAWEVYRDGKDLDSGDKQPRGIFCVGTERSVP